MYLPEFNFKFLFVLASFYSIMHANPEIQDGSSLDTSGLDNSWITASNASSLLSSQDSPSACSLNELWDALSIGDYTQEITHTANPIPNTALQVQCLDALDPWIRISSQDIEQDQDQFGFPELNTQGDDFSLDQKDEREFWKNLIQNPILRNSMPLPYGKTMPPELEATQEEIYKKSPGQILNALLIARALIYEPNASIIYDRQTEQLALDRQDKPTIEAPIAEVMNAEKIAAVIYRGTRDLYAEGTTSFQYAGTSFISQLCGLGLMHGRISSHLKSVYTGQRHYGANCNGLLNGNKHILAINYACVPYGTIPNPKVPLHLAKRDEKYGVDIWSMPGHALHYLISLATKIEPLQQALGLPSDHRITNRKERIPPQLIKKLKTPLLDAGISEEEVQNLIGQGTKIGIWWVLQQLNQLGKSNNKIKSIARRWAIGLHYELGGDTAERNGNEVMLDKTILDKVCSRLQIALGYYQSAPKSTPWWDGSPKYIPIVPHKTSLFGLIAGITACPSKPGQTLFNQKLWEKTARDGMGQTSFLGGVAHSPQIFSRNP